MQESHKNLLHPNILKRRNLFRVKSSGKSCMSTLCIYTMNDHSLVQFVGNELVYVYHLQQGCTIFNSESKVAV